MRVEDSCDLRKRSVARSPLSVEQPPPPSHRGVCVIDFGLVTDKNSAEERAVDLYVLERAIMSAHPLIKDVGGSVLRGYLRTIDASKGQATMTKLDAVRARGRKRSMVG